jgi:uncharacterized protein YndB with AHSA1/START domain
MTFSAHIGYVCSVSINNKAMPDSIIITVETDINAPIGKVWELWNTPEDIMQWNNMSAEWHTPKVENDLRAGGKFLFVMGLKDGSVSFDFTGTYDEVKTNEFIIYTLDDGRKAIITFTGNYPVKLTETFEPEDTQPVDMQREFCQAVVDRFKKYVEEKV